MNERELRAVIAGQILAGLAANPTNIEGAYLTSIAAEQAAALLAELDRTAMPHTQAEADEGRSAFGEAMARMAGKSPARAEFERAWDEVREADLAYWVRRSQVPASQHLADEALRSLNACETAKETSRALARELAKEAK